MGKIQLKTEKGQNIRVFDAIIGRPFARQTKITRLVIAAIVCTESMAEDWVTRHPKEKTRKRVACALVNL